MSKSNTAALILDLTKVLSHDFMSYKHFAFLIVIIVIIKSFINLVYPSHIGSEKCKKRHKTMKVDILI